MENRVKVMITKENGHPVSLWDKSLLPNKTKSQEACNVQYEYSTLFPLLSNSNCRQIVIEDLELFHPYFRVTKRLAEYIHGLCRVMTVKEVAEHLGLDWKTVTNIDKIFLESH